IGAQHADVGIGADQHPEMALEGVEAADGLRAIFIEVIRAIGTPCGNWTGQEWDEIVDRANGASSGTAASVRGGEGLVQVRMHDVKPEVSGPRDAEQRIQVGAVTVDEAASLVD